MNIDDYTILQECGRGGFGTVYLAKDPIERCVALKEISMTGTAGKREMQALKSYQKCWPPDFMLQIYHVGLKPERNSFYYTMESADSMAGENVKEYIPCTLSKVLERKQRLSVKQTTELVERLLETLAVIHGNRLVHRDIKPDNIFWVNNQVKLGDIGLLANENSMTCNAGSKGYMPSPNSCIKPNTSAVDLFALTRLIYRCLSGKGLGYFPELEPTDDISANGANLLELIFLSDEEISRMTVQDFQNILNCPPKSEVAAWERLDTENKKEWEETEAEIAHLQDKLNADEQRLAEERSRGDQVREELEEEKEDEEPLSSLSVLKDNAPADVWVKTAGITGTAIAGAAAIGMGVASVVAAPVAIAAGAAFLWKHLKEKDK